MHSDKMTIARNTTILMVTEVATRILGALLTILIARKLGASDLGMLTFAISFTDLFSFITQFGFRNLISRDLAKAPEQSPVYFGRILIIEVLFSACMLLIIFTVLHFMHDDPRKALIVSLAAVVLVLASYADIQNAFFRAHQHARYEAVIKIFMNFTVSATGIFLIWIGKSLVVMMAVRAAVYAAFCAVGFFLVSRKYGKPVFRLDLRSNLPLVKAAFPFAMLGIIVSVNNQIGTVMLSFMKGDEATGLYSAALRICGVLTFLPTAFVGSVLPAMSKYYKEKAVGYYSLSYERTVKYLFIMIIPIVVFFTISARPIIGLLYGAEFLISSPILQVLSWMLIFSFLNTACMIAFSAMDDERIFVRIQALGSIVNVAAGYLLIRKFSGMGLGMTVVLSQFFIFFWSTLRLSKSIPDVKILKVVFKPVVAASGMGLVLALIRNWNMAYTIPVCGLVYAVLLLSLKSFNLNEFSTVRSLFRSGRDPVI
jgi:O-antigen/teichoic acid export membrane protein